MIGYGLIKSPSNGDWISGTIEISGGLVTVKAPKRKIGNEHRVLPVSALSWPVARVRSDIQWLNGEPKGSA